MLSIRFYFSLSGSTQKLFLNLKPLSGVMWPLYGIQEALTDPYVIEFMAFRPAWFYICTGKKFDLVAFLAYWASNVTPRL